MRKLNIELDPYLAFNGPVFDGTPRPFIRLIDTIKRESEWQAVGLKIRKDKHGNYKPIVKKGLYFGFTRILFPEVHELNAIKTQKKITRHPSSVYALIKQGCNFDDFVLLTEDVIYYCKAMTAKEERRFGDAAQLIAKAYEGKHDEVLYADMYFEMRLILGDKSAIYDELEYYRHDVDVLIQTERVYEWIKYMKSTNSDVEANNIIGAINTFFDNLISGRITNRIYGEQQPDWYRHKKEQFNKTVAKTKFGA